MLAYINQEEADLLKARGGSGEPHADTGVPSFEVGEEYTDFDTPMPGETQATNRAFESARSEGESGASPSIRSYLPSYTEGAESGASVGLGGGAVPMTDASSGYYRPYYADPVAPEYQQYLQGQAGTFGDFASAPSGSTYTDENISGSLRDSAARAAVSPAYAPPTQDKDLLGQASDLLPNLSEETKKRLGIAGIQGLIGAYQTQQAAEQGRKAREEMAAMAAPYQQQGKELISKAQKGELSPVGQQQLQAVQAQAAQGAQARGGVGAQQAQAQVEAYRQQLLQGQYDYGLKVAGIGDQIMTGAIKTGMQADQYVNQLTSNYYNNIARAMYGQAPQVSGSQPASTSAGQ
jgi:hypothetical protein